MCEEIIVEEPTHSVISKCIRRTLDTLRRTLECTLDLPEAAKLLEEALNAETHSEKVKKLGKTLCDALQLEFQSTVSYRRSQVILTMLIEELNKEGLSTDPCLSTSFFSVSKI